MGTAAFNVQEFLVGGVNSALLENGTVDGGTVFLTRVDGQPNPALPRKLTEFPLDNAAFLEGVFDQGDEDTPQADRLSIYVSTFNPINFGVCGKTLIFRILKSKFNSQSILKSNMKY